MWGALRRVAKPSLSISPQLGAGGQQAEAQEAQAGLGHASAARRAAAARGRNPRPGGHTGPARSDDDLQNGSNQGTIGKVATGTSVYIGYLLGD